MTSITMYAKGDNEVLRAKNVIMRVASLSWALLFESDRWRVVDRAAIAYEGNTIVGLASLAPHDEAGNPQENPTIVGIWVHPDCRGQSVGLALIGACIQEARARYAAERITIEGVSPAGLRLAQKALAQGYPVIVKGMGMVPLP